MPYSKLEESDIRQLIDMVEVIHKTTERKLMPVLRKLQNNLPLNDAEKETLDAWSTLDGLDTDYTHKAAKPLVWVIRKWYGQ